MQNHAYIIHVFAVLMFSQLPLAAYAQRDEYEGPPINYSTAEVNDPVAKLARKVDSGELELNFDDRQGYLPAVLKLLDIPVSSQTLVFSGIRI